MASSLWADAVNQGRKGAWLEGWLEGWREGWRDGWREGILAGARRFCAELTREHHPELAVRLVPLIEDCSDVARLHEWGLQASRLPDSDFLRLVTAQAGSKSRPVGRGRIPRPSRTAKAKRA